ncbi:hypothetical protein BJ742DRAFT_907608 [Cladochytrium replicatum]|nr:hypothetical protein BJ742DRAFT_907608 [Cladochytrium replicatum]
MSVDHRRHIRIGGSDSCETADLQWRRNSRERQQAWNDLFDTPSNSDNSTNDHTFQQLDDHRSELHEKIKLLAEESLVWERNPFGDDSDQNDCSTSLPKSPHKFAPRAPLDSKETRRFTRSHRKDKELFQVRKRTASITTIHFPEDKLQHHRYTVLHGLSIGEGEGREIPYLLHRASITGNARISTKNRRQKQSLRWVDEENNSDTPSVDERLPMSPTRRSPPSHPPSPTMIQCAEVTTIVTEDPIIPLKAHISYPYVYNPPTASSTEGQILAQSNATKQSPKRQDQFSASTLSSTQTNYSTNIPQPPRYVTDEAKPMKKASDSKQVTPQALEQQTSSHTFKSSASAFPSSQTPRQNSALQQTHFVTDQISDTTLVPSESDTSTSTSPSRQTTEPDFTVSSTPPRAHSAPPLSSRRLGDSASAIIGAWATRIGLRSAEASDSRTSKVAEAKDTAKVKKSAAKLVEDCIVSVMRPAAEKLDEVEERLQKRLNRKKVGVDQIQHPL